MFLTSLKQTCNEYLIKFSENQSAPKRENRKTLWVSVGRYWLAHSGTGSVWSGTGWFLVILGQYGAFLVGNWWYWISIGRYWLMKDAVFGDWAVCFDSAVT